MEAGDNEAVFYYSPLLSSPLLSSPVLTTPVLLEEILQPRPEQGN